MIFPPAINFTLVLIITIFLLAGTYLSARASAPSYGGAIVLAGVVAVTPCFFLLISPFHWLLTGVVAVLAVISHLARLRPRTFLALSTTGTVLTYLGLFWYTNSGFSEWGRARQQFPLVTMSERLAYERSPERRARSARPSNFDESQASRSLERIEVAFDHDPVFANSSQTWIRMDGLRRLHENAIHRFVTSPGFGQGRMHPQRTRAAIQLPRVEPVLVPEPHDDYRPGTTASEEPRPRKPSLVTGGLPALGHLHEASILDFAHPRGFGSFRDRDHVAGFEPHRFSKIPEEGSAGGEAVLQVRRLELVSLLKHEQPAVYLSRHLPRMDELKDAPTRRLDEFEAAALPLLQKGEDIVTDSEAGKVRMLGAIRAGKNCLSCHDVERGDLLGAFSYVLRREGASPRKDSQEGPP